MTGVKHQHGKLIGNHRDYHINMTERDIECLHEFKETMRRLRDGEKLTNKEMAAIADLNPSVVNSFFMLRPTQKIIAMLRIFDSCGYEMVLVKRKDRVMLSTNAKAREAYEKMLEKERKRTKKRFGTDTKIKQQKQSKSDFL